MESVFYCIKCIVLPFRKWCQPIVDDDNYDVHYGSGFLPIRGCVLTFGDEVLPFGECALLCRIIVLFTGG